MSDLSDDRPDAPGVLTPTDPVDVPLTSIQPHPGNPRVGNVDAIRQSIQVNGFVGCVLVQRSTGHILAGNHRYRAALELNLPTIPAAYVDCDDRKALEILLIDNRLSDNSVYESTSLADILRTLQESASLAGTGFSEKDAERILKSVFAPEEAEEESLDPGDDRAVNTVARIGDVQCRVDGQQYRAFINRIRMAHGFHPHDITQEITRLLMESSGAPGAGRQSPGEHLQPAEI